MPGDDAYDLIVAIASSASTGVVADVQLAAWRYLTADVCVIYLPENTGDVRYGCRSVGAVEVI